METQRAASLIETSVALAIVALIAGAAVNAAVVALHAAAPSAVTAALEIAVRREMRVALDVLKYRGAAIAPATVATTLPMPAGSPLPVRLTLATSGSSGRGLRVDVTATAIVSREHVTLTAILADRAPLPGAILRKDGLVPAPTGAP